MAIKMPDRESFKLMEKVLKSGEDEDKLMKQAYVTYPKRDFTFQQGDCKDFSVAEVQKHLGNFHFQNKSFKDALEHYNVGIIKCPQETAEERELLSILLANRSAVFLKMEEYEKGLNDIFFIEELGCYPAHIDYKLPWRKAKCFEALQEFEKADEAYDEALKMLEGNCSLAEIEREKKMEMVKMLKKNKRAKQRTRPELKTFEDIETFKGGEKYVGASPLIDINCDEKNGRYAVAVEDIPVGTLIVKEEPYVAILLESKSTMNCQHCFASITQFLPCPKCANVVFCGAACMKIALESYHGLECPIYGSLQECGPTAALVLRIFTQNGFSFFHDQKSKLMEYLEDECHLGLPEKDVYRHDDHDNIMKLFRNECRSDGFDVFVHCSTAFIMHALKLIKFFPFETSKDTISMDEELFIAKLILRHYRMANYNINGISEIYSHKNKIMLRNGLESFFEMVRIGIGLFPTFAFFNHSCEPSVIRTTLNREILVRTIKPIRAGEIIYDNYGYHYLWTPRQERQKFLEKNYCFKCTCVPCEENWPGSERLEAIINVPCKNKNCNVINPLTIRDLNQRRCISCRRLFHPDAITNITSPMYKQLAKADALRKERKYDKALKLYIKVLSNLYKYASKPDMWIIKVQENIDVCMAHFGNKSTSYYERYFSSLSVE